SLDRSLVFSDSRTETRSPADLIGNTEFGTSLHHSGRGTAFPFRKQAVARGSLRRRAAPPAPRFADDEFLSPSLRTPVLHEHLADTSSVPLRGDFEGEKVSRLRKRHAQRDSGVASLAAKDRRPTFERLIMNREEDVIVLGAHRHRLPLEGHRSRSAFASAAAF